MTYSMFNNKSILITGGTVRVAIKSDVTYTFGRAIGLGSARVGGRAMVKTIGDLLPIAVLRPVFRSPRRYGAGPGTTTRRVRVRQLLPGAFAMIVGAALITAPLGVTRHFYPDTGWALTSLAWLALALGAVHVALTFYSERIRARRN